jgi:hypothetical protein
MHRWQQDQCLDCTRRFVGDPLCAFFFLNPVDLGSDSANAEYRQVVRSPMDLTTVQSRLREREYVTVQSWAADFALIFDNAIKFDQNISFISGIAQYYKQKLQKHAARIALSSDGDYIKRFGIAFAAYLDVLSKPPPSLTTSVAPVDAVGGAFEEHSLDLLAQKLNKMMSEDVNRELMRLLGVTEKGEEIDVGSLSHDDVKALWAFVREKEGQCRI